MLFALDDIKDFWGKVKGRIRSILKMPENIKHCNTNNTENTNTNAKWKRCRIFLLAVVANISAAKVAGTQGNIGWIVLMVLGAFPEYVVIIAKISERAWRDTELEFLQYIRVKDEPSSLMVYHTFGKIVELAFIAEISRKGLEPGLVLVVCVMFAIDNIKDFASKVKDVTRFILKMPEYIVNRIKSVLEFADYQYADAKITDSEPADDQVAEAEPEDDQVAEAKPADDSELTNTEITADDQFADAVSEENNSAAPLKVYVASRPKKSKNLLPLLPFAVAAIAIVCAVCVDKKLSRKRE
jgi:hypothetical protein